MWIDINSGKIYKAKKEIEINGVKYAEQVFDSPDNYLPLGIKKYLEVNNVQSDYYLADSPIRTETATTVTVTINNGIQKDIEDKIDSETGEVLSYGLKSSLKNDAVSSEEIAYIDSLQTIDDIINYKSTEMQKFRDKDTLKRENLAKLIIEQNLVKFQADQSSINYMSCVMSVAMFNMLKSVYGMLKSTPEEELSSYELIFIQMYQETLKSIVPWKNADDKISEVQIETIAEALELSMKEIAKIITGVENV